MFVALEENAATFGNRLGRILYDLDALRSLRPKDETAHPLDERLVRMVKEKPNRAASFAGVAASEVPFWAANFAARVALVLAAAMEDPEAKASFSGNAANHLSALGRREEALAAAQEAADLFRALAEARPEAFTPNLAGSLNNLANRLSELGRQEEALAEARPEAFTPNLAMSLNNLALMLFELGRHEEALAAAQEAVDIRRGAGAPRGVHAGSGHVAEQSRHCVARTWPPRGSSGGGARGSRSFSPAGAGAPRRVHVLSGRGAEHSRQQAVRTRPPRKGLGGGARGGGFARKTIACFTRRLECPGNMDLSQTYIGAGLHHQNFATEALPPPDFFRTQKSINLTLPERSRCLRPCKVLNPNRTKMFHVKHFGKIARAKNAPRLVGLRRSRQAAWGSVAFEGAHEQDGKVSAEMLFPLNLDRKVSRWMRRRTKSPAAAASLAADLRG
jgi:tetratricopeptide (TPR) repeat protein